MSEAALIFNEHAVEYDKWYDNSTLFDIEIGAIRASSLRFLHPGLEIGVGAGRFAQALNIEFGIDPALSPLQLAQHRSIISLNGIGEQLPVRTHSIGTVYLFFTLCFLTDPAAVFKEVFRVLKPGGYVLIGFIPGLSEWGKHLALKGREKHPYYRHARFQTVADTKALLEEIRFQHIEAWSSLFQPPSQTPYHETPINGESEDAGFCVLIASKQGV